jgi:hypothetical protein
MTTPIDAYFEKKSSFMNSVQEGAKKLPGAIGSAGAGAVAAAGAAGIGVAASKVYDAITKRRDFHAMLENNPGLHDHLRQNPKFFNLAYSSLRASNPGFSRDPIIAGQYMMTMMDSPAHAGNVLVEAMQQMQHGRSPVMDALGKGALEGAKSGMNAKSEGGSGSPVR